MKLLRALLTATAVCTLAAHAQDTPAPDASTAPNPKDLKPRPAEMAPLAAKSLLLALVKAGDHFVAVGDRGVIVVSPDGDKWQQVPSPVHATLTTASFADAQNGWAAGHDAAILHTADGGKTWTLQNFQPGLNKPVLSLLALDAQRAFAMGAYGLFLSTSDGGKTWKQLEAPALLADGPHLNSMIKLGDGELFIAGETGLLAVSHDGAQWTRLKLPYAGSLFGALPRGDKGALVYGLRGNVFVSDDVHSNRWTRIDTGTVLSFFGGTRLANGNAALVGADGEVLLVTPAGAVSSARVAGDERTFGSGTLSGVLARDGELLVVGETGVGHLKVAETAKGTPAKTGG